MHPNAASRLRNRAIDVLGDRIGIVRRRNRATRAESRSETKAESEAIPTAVTVLARAALFACWSMGENGRTEAIGPGKRLRENGPAVLVPLAWIFALAAHLGVLADRTVLIAHVVMDVLLAAFAAASWSEMTTGVLRAWKVVILVGLCVTLSATAVLFGRSGEESSGTRNESPKREASGLGDRVLALAVLAWMVVPAAGLAYTGRAAEAENGSRVYLVGAVLSALGALRYGSAPTDSPNAPRKVLGLVLVNAGQTAGIVNAVYQH